ncbi:hypothetical protein EON77_08925 [bacterium]|nr:MAG: hypothetical protein EON77_08925 [bacterium]
MTDGRKKAVSLRLDLSDIRRVKRLAQRLGVRDSEIIRYALQQLLQRLSPLTDPALKGRALVPLFLDTGTELVREFDLDAQRLDAIINDGVPAEVAVPIDDLHLLTLNAASPPPLLAVGDAGDGDWPYADRRTSPVRRYLYQKYLCGTRGEGPRAHSPEVDDGRPASHAPRERLRS